MIDYRLGAACALLLSVLLSFDANAQALTVNEIACSKGGAEACFYAGADYASGQGVTASKPKAAELFVKACQLGIPDGCYYTAGMYRKGAEGIVIDKVKGLALYEKACTMGHEESCKQILWAMGTDKTGEQDLPRLLTALEQGCPNQSVSACGWASQYRYDGNRGRHPEFIDFVRGAPLAAKACDLGDPYACIPAEIMYANPESVAFDAAQALKYTNLNCNKDVKESCSNLGRIYSDIKDYDLAVTKYEKSCQLGNQTVCAYAKDLRRYVTEMAEWNAKQQARRSEMNSMLKNGDYNGAVATAVSVYKSTDYAEQAVVAASNAGRMGQIDDYDLKVLEHWFQSGQIAGLVRSEMRRRGLAISGEDNSWANDMKTIKSANERFNAARKTSTYRPVEQAQAPSGTVLNMAEASAKTREKYRHAHCTMNNNANRYLCQ